MIVGILCPSYSGSTVLHFALGSLPGAAAVGETYRLLEPPPWPFCEEHREACPVFTPEVRREFSAPRPDWYSRLAAVLGARVLVTSDKLPMNYARVGQCVDRMIVLRRDLRDLVASHVKHWRMGHWANVQPVPARWVATDDEVRERITFLRHALDGCRGLAATFSGDGKREVCLEDFQASPAVVLADLAAWLDLPSDAASVTAALRFWERDHHYVGGNFVIKAHHRGPGKQHEAGWTERHRQRIAPPLAEWREHLTPEQAARVLEALQW